MSSPKRGEEREGRKETDAKRRKERDGRDRGLQSVDRVGEEK